MNVPPTLFNDFSPQLMTKKDGDSDIILEIRYAVINTFFDKTCVYTSLNINTLLFTFFNVLGDYFGAF